MAATAAYRHFGSLPDLVDAVSAACLTELARSMEAELRAVPSTADPQEHAWARMRAIGRGYVRFALREPGLFAVAFNRHQQNTDPAIGAGDSGRSAKALLEHGLDALVAAGLLTPADRPAAATAAWASVHGLSMLLLGPLADVAIPEREATIESTLELVGRGLIIRP